MGKKQNKKQQKTESQHFQVFISGLQYESTQQDIKNFFDFANQPIIKLPKYQDTGRCLGYGHVQFKTKDQCQKALQKNGQHIGKRYITIQLAKGKKPLDDVKDKTIPVGCKCLFIKNLPYQITQEQIKKQFQSCGVIKDVRMIKNWQTKKFKGFAYIDFKDIGSVKKALLKYHGKNYKGRDLVLDAVTTTMKKGFKRFDKGQNNQQENIQYNNQQNQDNIQQQDQDQISDEQ